MTRDCMPPLDPEEEAELEAVLVERAMVMHAYREARAELDEALQNGY